MAGCVPKCIDCRCNLPRSVPRISYADGWRCSDCAAQHELGDLPTLPPKPRIDRKHPQKEQLFDD